jgi:O-6-methylguanine DNA methyltransferase
MNVCKSFKERVLDVVKNIPKGEVLCYGEVAMRAGAFGAGRAVGTIMSKNKDKTIPCHRVVRRDGKVGNYNGLHGKHEGPNQKYLLLKQEGVKFKPAYKVMFQ